MQKPRLEMLHMTVFVTGSLGAVYTMDGANNDNNMQVAASQNDEVFYSHIFPGYWILSKPDIFPKRESCVCLVVTFTLHIHKTSVFWPHVMFAFKYCL